MYRKFALFVAALSVCSFVLAGCPKAEETASSATDVATNTAKDGAGAGVNAGKDAVAAVTDPAKLLEALKVEPGLADVKIQKNDKGELVMTGKVADQGLKAKAEELIKAAGGTVKNAIIVGK